MHRIGVLKSYFFRNVDKFFLYTLIAVVITFPISIRLSSSLIIVGTLIWLLEMGRNKSFFIKKGCKIPLLLFSIVFLLKIIGLIYSQDLARGIFHVEKNLSLLTFPLLFFTGGIYLSKKEVTLILNVFTFSIISFCAYSHFALIFQVLSENVDLAKINNFEYSYTSLSSFLGIHPTYFSLYIIFGLAIILFKWIPENTVKNQIILLIVSSYLIVFIIHLSSRIGLLAVILVLLVFVFSILKSKKTGYIIITTILFFSVFSIALNFFKISKIRITSTIENYYSFIKNGEQLSNYNEQRLYIWDCIFDSFNEEMILFGYGTGDASFQLNTCYSRKGYDILMSDKFNAHNEFVSTTLRAGMVGLVSLLLLIMYSFYRAIKFSDIILGVFVILIVTVGMTESFLSRQMGTVFFAFFLSILLYLSNFSLKDNQ